VGQLAAGIAHDFNNNLAVITLYSQLLQRSQNLSLKERDKLAIIAEQAKRAAGLTAQILDFSRRSVLKQQTLDLAPFLKELAKLLERTLEEHILVKLKLGSGPFLVNADPTRIQQVMMNLAINARDAMSDGGELAIGLTRASSDAGRTGCPYVTPAGEWIKLTVSDTGIGIPADVLPHIFEPFFSTKAPGEGTGLGLAQVWGIVQQHQGHITVASQAGKGTTFTLCLPALKVAQQNDRSQRVAAIPTGKGELVLIVEDDAGIRSALGASLVDLNYRVMEAANGREALAIVDDQAANQSDGPEDRIALVLSDVVMPEMDGQTLFRRLKEKRAGIKMVMMTGHPLDKKLENLKDKDLNGWLSKPPSLADLAQTISQALKEESFKGQL
jgi:CheY-like chemotaxis protein